MPRGNFVCARLFPLLLLAAEMTCLALFSGHSRDLLCAEGGAGGLSGGIGRAEEVAAEVETEVKVGAKPQDPAMFHLRGGGMLVGQLGIVLLPVRTRYGDLHVPLREVQQIRFARRIPVDLRTRIEKAIAQLAEADFDRREEAMRILREIGPPARSFLTEALKSRDEEVKNRAETLLSQVARGSVKVEDDEMDSLGEAEDDEVIARRFTLRGEVLSEGYSVATAYGELKVLPEDLVGISLSGDLPVARKFTVAADFTVPERWFDAKTILPPGSTIRVTAKGRLFVSNYNLYSGPEGTKRYSGTTFNNFPMLSLVGRIGKDGTPFLVGKECRTKVKKEGKLYLGVVPFRRNYAATGSYEVKVDAVK